MPAFAASPPPADPWARLAAVYAAVRAEQRRRTLCPVLLALVGLLQRDAMLTHDGIEDHDEDDEPLVACATLPLDELLGRGLVRKGVA